MTEQQQHLANLVEQRESLKKTLEELQNTSNMRRELYWKVQGAIEYLSGTGVELPEPEVTEEAEAEAEAPAEAPAEKG